MNGESRPLSRKVVSVVTINYNNFQTTVELLVSIRSMQNEEIEVIVIDNNSSEDPGAYLTTWFPWIKFIRSPRNLGFAGGNNLGIMNATGEYIFLINNDTEFRVNIFSKLVNQLKQNPHIGAISPLIHYFSPPDRVQFAGYTQINRFTGRNECITERPSDERDGVLYTSYAHGAAMMIPRRIIDIVGLMPESYFLYFEELDWCETIRRAGFKIAVDQHSIIYHKESSTTQRISELKSYFMSRNRILFMRRNFNFWSRIVFMIYFLALATPGQIAKYLVRLEWRNIMAHLAGIKWNMQFATDSRYIGYKFNYLNRYV